MIVKLSNAYDLCVGVPISHVIAFNKDEALVTSRGLSRRTVKASRRVVAGSNQ